MAAKGRIPGGCSNPHFFGYPREVMMLSWESAMSLPTLYWMLECRLCRTRWVVFDTYLEFISSGCEVAAPGAGWGGRPLPERYGCPSGCPIPPTVVGSIFSLEDEEVWLEKPHRPERMTKDLRDEWASLIRKAGLQQGK